MTNISFDVPVILFVFRRLDTVKLIFEKLREIKPTKLYVFADGAREGLEDETKKVKMVRDYIATAVDWNCDFIPEYAEKNKGCAANICEGIYSVFEKETSAIILEDDAVPMKEFFWYCKYLLEKYEKDTRIQYIAGFNAIGDTEVIENSYDFSYSAPMSGAIAMWSDRWKRSDFQMKRWPSCKKNNTFRKYYYFRELYKRHCKSFDDAYNNLNDGWDIQLRYNQLLEGTYAIIPKGNLACSYGHVEGAFHPQSKREARNLKKIMSTTKCEFVFPMIEPKQIVVNQEYDKMRQKLWLKVPGNYLQRHIHYLYLLIKELAYKHMPKKMWKFIKRIIKG